MESVTTIGVIGLGYVGLPLALLAGRKGYRVIGIDANAAKVEKINKKIAPYFDIKIVQELAGSNLEATTDFSRLKEASIIIICVPTPIDNKHQPDLEPVESASRQIAVNLLTGQLVVLESTVNPAVCETVILPILEKGSGLTGGQDFYLAHCPERINPGDMKWNLENIPRVVGSLETIGLGKALDFYRSIISAEIKPMGSLKEAEAVKIIENSFRDINIAFVNELAMSFSKLGIDLLNVIDGAATKPFAFLPHWPGCGVGGHCIPVDPYYLITYAQENGFNHSFLKLARHINNYMPQYTVKLVADGLAKKNLTLQGSRVAVLGLAYKAEVDDCRESPSFEIIHWLKKNGAEVVSFDPFVLERSTAKTLEEALQGSKAIVIATGHSMFRELSPDYLLNKEVSVVIDGRNCLPKEDFVRSNLIYQGIGR